MTKPTLIGEIIPKLLEGYGVDTVFGIPGVHTIEMYRGLSATGIRHVTPRHEQGAGFMADGYARVSGKPGVCFIITGPGLTNIATAMGQALQDSIPMLVISSVNTTEQLGMGEGRLHEMRDQKALLSQVSRYSHTLLSVANLPKVLARAFAVMTSDRPGPVHIEIPIDLLGEVAGEIDTQPWPLPKRPALSTESASQIMDELNQASRPVMVIGGGARHAGDELRQLAEQLDLPVINTTNAKGVIPCSHELSVGGSPSSLPVRQLLAEEADLILAIGTEFAETDFDFFFTGNQQVNGRVIRIDIDSQQLYSNVKPFMAYVSDSLYAAMALLQALGNDSVKRNSTASPVVERIKEQLAHDRNDDYHRMFETIKCTLPGAIVVGDSCQPCYYACEYYEADSPNRYFHSASGFGTLGYAIPAALGAKLAAESSPVVCLSGDGGSQFSAMELMTAMDEGIQVIFIIWQNGGHKEIRLAMERNDVPLCGVDVAIPDYRLLAQSTGMVSASAASTAELEGILSSAKASQQSILITLDESQLIAQS